MNNKGKGIRFEREVKADLEAKGYFVARQASSLFPDLIAIQPGGKIIFVECKAGKRHELNKEEKEALINLAKRFNACAIHTYPVYSDRKKKTEYSFVYTAEDPSMDNHYFCDFICEKRDSKDICVLRLMDYPEKCKHYTKINRIEKEKEFVV